MTLTFPHEREMPLKETMVKFAKARQSFKNCKDLQAHPRQGHSQGFGRKP